MFFLIPLDHRPPTRLSNSAKLVRWIHCRRPPYRSDQPAIIQVVAIRVASTQVELHLLRQPLRRARLRFPKHRFAQNLSGKLAVPLFQPRRNYANHHRDSARRKPGFHGARCSPRQRLERPADQHDLVPLLRMPCHRLDRWSEKGGDRQSWIAPRRSRRLSLGLVAIFLPRGDISISLVTLVKNLKATKIHFVALQNLADPAWHQPQRFQ